LPKELTLKKKKSKNPETTAKSALAGSATPGSAASEAAASGTTLPVLCIVGRPNVGKSTLFNRITGRRRAIVGDEPGITRDRLYSEAEWDGNFFRLVDTGGIVPDDDDFIPSEIFRQARFALDEAAAIIVVVDGRGELAGPDMELTRLLHRTGKPLFLAVNKIDSDKQEHLAENFRTLGIRNVYPISAEHGIGVGELLEAVFEIPAMKQKSEAWKRAKAAREELELSHADREESLTDGDSEVAPPPAVPAEIKVAIIGRPNVGKSTLLNQLTGADRSIVSPIAGTTRDAIDEVVERNGQRFRFIDTAGIRRKGKTKLMAEKLSVIMARKHLEDADIALLVIDAPEGVAALDAHIAGYAHESGRSVIVVVNKWDLVTKAAAAASHGTAPVASRLSKAARLQTSKQTADRELYEQRLRGELKFLAYAPVLFVSASMGRGVDQVFEQVVEVAAERNKRISTGEMNRFLKHLDFERAPVPARQQVRIYYMTQAAVAPPTFILFCDRVVKLHFSYQRYLENQIRAAFGFVGTPIWIKTRGKG
jgi:GTP-binding protein